MNSHDPKKLEEQIHRMLRSLPDRKAPSGLEGRVLAELSRRAALPWWRKSYAHWPAPARAVFFVGSALAAAILVSGVILVTRSADAAGLASGASQRFAWLWAARDLFQSTSANLGRLIASVPQVWLYGAVGAVTVLYATLAAIGAAAYRALSHVRANP
jgi:hypothetical protein